MRTVWRIGRGWLARRAGVMPARALRRCRRATVALEYGLLSGLVAVGVVVGAGKLGASLNRTFVDLATKVTY